jgi:hypothetical protein
MVSPEVGVDPTTGTSLAGEGSKKVKGRNVCCDLCPAKSTFLTATNQWISLIVVTPIHPASYPALVTIVTTNVRTPIIAVPPIAIITIGTIDMAVIPIGAVVAVVAVSAAVISTAIYAPIMSAVDAIVGLRLVHRQ